VSSSSTSEFIQAAYARLRENLAAKEIGAEHLRTAAMDALDRARAQVELDPQLVAQELDRIHTESLRDENDPPSP
jgi:hypothetical protein